MQAMAHKTGRFLHCQYRPVCSFGAMVMVEVIVEDFWSRKGHWFMYVDTDLNVLKRKGCRTRTVCRMYGALGVPGKINISIDQQLCVIHSSWLVDWAYRTHLTNISSWFAVYQVNETKSFLHLRHPEILLVHTSRTNSVSLAYPSLHSEKQGERVR